VETQDKMPNFGDLVAVAAVQLLTVVLLLVLDIAV
jgi:hypothetical protein